LRRGQARARALCAVQPDCTCVLKRHAHGSRTGGSTGQHSTKKSRRACKLTCFLGAAMVRAETESAAMPASTYQPFGGAWGRQMRSRRLWSMWATAAARRALLERTAPKPSSPRSPPIPLASHHAPAGNLIFFGACVFDCPWLSCVLCSHLMAFVSVAGGWGGAAGKGWCRGTAGGERR
jgi:hypothetical protein